MLKLLISYYSAPSIQAARPCRSPIKQDDDDLAPATHYFLAQPRSADSIEGHAGIPRRTTTSTSSVNTNAHGLGIGGGGGKSTQDSSNGPNPSGPLDVLERAGQRTHTGHRRVCTRISSHMNMSPTDPPMAPDLAFLKSETTATTVTTPTIAKRRR